MESFSRIPNELRYFKVLVWGKRRESFFTATEAKFDLKIE